MASNQDLMGILNNAARLMTPESNKLIDQYKNMNPGRLTEGFSLDENVPELNYTFTPPPNAKIPSAMDNNNGGKNLPAAIRESILNNPLQQTNPLGIPGGSILDKLVPPPQNQFQSQQPVMHIPIVSENRQVMTNVPSANIDYGVIKSLIDESVRRHVDELKGTITESAKKGSPSLGVMKIGEKLQFLDNKGNLYEAQLKFIKNVSKK